MKVIAVNGGPRKQWNTATLLHKALEGAQSVGAETDLFHLYDLNYKGCISCFGCKRKNSSRIGHCVLKDELTPLLKEVLKCDALLLGSPIYFGNVTGEMRSFLERLFFSLLSYNEGQRTVFPRKVASGFIYTMNVPEDFLPQLGYEAVFKANARSLELLNGPSEYLLATDTYQFDNYSNYASSRFNEQHKAQVRQERFPQDCRQAFDLGARLSGRNAE
ncbi:NADPH-dependent FMN reductase [Desulfitobacterium sp. LBE]|uniref:Multimeric flavodoxin WrbA n=2 Tax=root TaxID=1 RepID=A0A098B9A7_DESHA|nr:MULTISPECIES: flavodoxin family protein [Desulfitobacterium]MEA5024999.1 flavodoxin family protein [Desulfitobacterium hafniense]TWH57915.1 NADPH-dependent FMN reductase [Desulfitobacterium sp. LBE]CDX04441.1 Multimeric flavodoxin WrbA [Desulfitobacterium hafniense]